ncbi:hypothetical protein LCGC14_0223760 [marine sediment metagenome]|uniref:Uncharacterized protein n=1 Tax=marine sediment metagenome TaxID=412755 RepID=A0A0F9XFY8_9ZZZZ
MIIFIDGERKFKFMKGYNIKLGAKMFKIMGIEELRWKEAIGSVATGIATTKDWDTYMKPLDNYIYFVEYMGIDGFCGFALQFPKGIVHGAPRGQTEYVYKDEAGKLNPMFYPFLISSPDYPTWAVFNAAAIANNSDAYFFGERWRVKILSGTEIQEIGSNFTEMTDYANSGIGQG